MKFKLLFLRVSSVIIDISIIYTFALIIYIFIPPNPLIDILRVLFLIMILYFFISYLFPNQTPGKYLLQLKLLPINNQKLTLTDIIIREFLYKYLIGFLLPYAVLYLLKWVDFMPLFPVDPAGCLMDPAQAPEYPLPCCLHQ